MIKRKKQKQQAEEQREQEEQQQQEYNEIRQYQKIINKIWAQLEAGTLYHYADSLLQCAEAVVECVINTILDLAKPRF